MTIKEAVQRIEDHIRVHRIGEHPHIKLFEALRMAIGALRAQEEWRWIPVTESLPDDFEQVLVYRPGMYYEFAVTKMVNGDWVEWGKTIANKDAITHWMPIPKPPKEEQK